MTPTVSLHHHAIARLNERFSLDQDWLSQELDQGRFVWLKGSGANGSEKNSRSGHLIYIPYSDEYCVVIMDDRSRLAISVLTEAMALKSSWGAGMSEVTKLQAKRIVLGEKIIPDSHFLRVYAEQRNELSVSVKVRALSGAWKLTMVPLMKLTLTADQIDPVEDQCTLTDEQCAEVSRIIHCKIADGAILPYGELLITNSHRSRTTRIANRMEGVATLEEGEAVRRAALEEREAVRRWQKGEGG